MAEKQIFENINKEAERIEEDTEFSAKRHFNAADFWLRVHYFIGIPMTALAAIGGIKAFGENPEWAGYFAIAAAVLGALQTFVNPEEKASKHKVFGGQYLTLRNDARLFRSIELSADAVPDAREKIIQLSKRRNDLNESAPNTPACAHKKAKRDIEDGFSKYQTDKEPVEGEGK